MAGSAFDLTGTRLQDSTRVNQAAEDADVINWNTANDFIVCAMVETINHAGASGTLQLRWRNVTDSGAFTALSATGELTWSATTDLVNGTAVASGEEVCTPTSGVTRVDGVEREGANDVSTTLAQNEYAEHQWAIDASGALSGKQYEFEIFDATEGTTLGTGLAQLTMDGVAPDNSESITISDATRTFASNQEASSSESIAIVDTVTANISVGNFSIDESESIIITDVPTVSLVLDLSINESESISILPISDAWNKGFNFRSTSGYVTDGLNETFVLSDIYPTTRNGVTFGWSTSPNAKFDLNNGLDRRLAGQNQKANNSSPINFRVDLPATGDYVITLALGQPTFAMSPAVEVKDDATVLRTIDSDVSDADQWFDAIGVERTSASDWVSNNVSEQRTFSSTIFRLNCGISTYTDPTVVGHVFLSLVTDAGTEIGLEINETESIDVIDSPAASISGADLIVDDSESITITDAPSIVFDLSIDDSEFIVVSDVSFVNILGAGIAIDDSELITIADSPAIIIGVLADVFESVNISDFPTLNIGLFVDDAESIMVSDAPFAQVGIFIDEAESIAVTDAPFVNVSGAGLGVNEAESITVGDIPLAAIGVSVDEAESITLADIIFASIAVAPALSVNEFESITVGDSPLASIGVFIAGAESITVVDAPSLQIGLEATVAESIGITDDPSMLTGQEASAVEAMAVNDSVNLTFAQPREILSRVSPVVKLIRHTAPVVGKITNKVETT